MESHIFVAERYYGGKNEKGKTYGAFAINHQRVTSTGWIYIIDLRQVDLGGSLETRGT
jgi:hypothetical protein